MKEASFSFNLSFSLSHSLSLSLSLSLPPSLTPPPSFPPLPSFPPFPPFPSPLPSLPLPPSLTHSLRLGVRFDSFSVLLFFCVYTPVAGCTGGRGRSSVRYETRFFRTVQNSSRVWLGDLKESCFFLFSTPPL